MSNRTEPDHAPAFKPPFDTSFDGLTNRNARYERSRGRRHLLPALERIRLADLDLAAVMELSASYAEQFAQVSTALYRDGNDCVALYGDTIARHVLPASVVTVSIGSRGASRSSPPPAATPSRCRSVEVTCSSWAARASTSGGTRSRRSRTRVRPRVGG